MKLTTTSTTQLYSIGEALGVPKLKILSVDELPKRMNIGSYIINMDDLDGPGTHWTCAYYGANQPHVVYFDPFGVEVDPRIKKFTKSQKKKDTCRIDNQIQAVDASSCGWWCLYFLFHMHHGVSPEDFASSFNTLDQEENEEKLREFYSDL